MGGAAIEMGCGRAEQLTQRRRRQTQIRHDQQCTPNAVAQSYLLDQEYVVA